MVMRSDRCPRCGFGNKPGVDLCTQCGASLSSGRRPSQKWGWRGWTALTVVAVVILILVGVASEAVDEEDETTSTGLGITRRQLVEDVTKRLRKREPPLSFSCEQGLSLAQINRAQERLGMEPLAPDDYVPSYNCQAGDDEPLSGSFSVSGHEEDIQEVEAHWMVSSPIFSPIAYRQGLHLASVVFHFACFLCAIEDQDWFADALRRVYEGEVREASAVFGNRSVVIKGVGVGEKEAAVVFLSISNATGGQRPTETASEADSPGEQVRTQAEQTALEQQGRCPDFDPTQLPWTLEGTPSLSGMSVVELEWTGYNRLEAKLVVPPEEAAKLNGRRLADFHLMVQSDNPRFRIGNGATSAVWAWCNRAAENVLTTQHLDDQFFQQGDWGVLKLRFEPLGDATASAARSAEIPASLDFRSQTVPLELPINRCGPNTITVNYRDGTSKCEERE